MRISTKEELLLIEGGLDISAALISAFTTGIKTILDVGRSLGTSIRRIITGKICNVC